MDRETCKYADWTKGQEEALINIIGEGNAKALLAGDLTVSFEKAVKTLFDKNGRRIPRDLKSAVCDANKDFYLVQPKFKTVTDYSDRLIRFQEAFREGPVMSAAEFEGRSKELIAEIENNKNLCNLLNGIYLPIILPRLENFTDYGKTLEKVFLPAVKFSYEKQFPSRKFNNYRKNDLAGKVSIVFDSRHEKLIEKMKQGYTVVIYFPDPLQGFSINASREQIVSLPESLILAGGFDTASAIAMYSDVLAKDWHTPGYDLSALSWQSPDYSLDFWARDDGLGFDGGAGLGDAVGRYSSGLLFLGECC